MADEVDINIGTFDLSSANGVSIDSIAVQINKSVSEYALPKFDGSIIPIGKRKSMALKLSGAVAAANYDALRTALDSLKNAFDTTAEVIFTTDDDRQVYVQYKSFSYAYKTLRTFATFSVELVASNPYWLSKTLNADTTTPSSGVHYHITNAGNAPARCKITFTAPGGSAVADALQFANSTTGESLQYRGTIAASKALIVNNNVDNAGLVVTNDGTSDFPNFEGDFITLAAGENTLTLTSSVASIVVKIEWRDTYK